MAAPAYTERPAGRPGWVAWSRSAPATAFTHRVLPDGCLDVLWTGSGDDAGELVVAGPDTSAQVTTTRPGQAYAGVRFGPGLGPGVLGVPADELRDRRVPLDALWPPARVRELAERVAALPEDPADPVGRAAGLARLLARVEAVSGPPCLPAVVAAHLSRGFSVAATADRTGYSERQLRRRCLAAFGYGPKTFARIMRLGRALDLARAGTPYAAVAQAAGYADQAHLAREVRELAGVPLGELLAA